MDHASLTQALTHIQAHLDGDLSLNALATVAGCSPPYFARRFAALMRETPKHYTSRLRLERAALRLVLLNDPIINIALDCGFANHETFSRAFRRRFRVSPSAFREKRRLPTKPDAKAELPQRASAATPISLSSTSIRTLQPMSLAFIRHTGPYVNVPLTLWDTLLDWARRHKVPGPYILLGIAHDAPGITPDDKLRFDAAIRIPDSWGEFRPARRSRIGHQHLPGGLFALTTNVGPFTSLPAAYAEIFQRLRHNRSLAVVGLPCVEFYRVNRVTTDTAIVHTEIAVPVRNAPVRKRRPRL
ncbi:MAG: hypothetical protein HBSAPP03_19370 [Phycisphaerae bacterium]|nr:MAG: hypothetical protein HBSAPP03_19370 [Phycisphaerae bacterium]